MAFPSIVAPDPSDPFAFASIHLLLHNENLHKQKLFCSLGPHNILPFASPARHDRRRHRKRKSRKCSASKRAALHYLKPGALAQMRDAARTAVRAMSFSDLYGSSKCDQVDSSERGDINGLQLHLAEAAALSNSGMLPVAKAFGSTKFLGPFCPQRKKLLAPRTPLSLPAAAVSTTPASVVLPTTDFDSLPLELLVRIVCNLRHDQLKPAFHVSRRFRQAVLIARQCHFDFTTPDREQHTLRLNTLGNVKMAVPGMHAAGSSRPMTPMAPRQAQKPLHARVAHVDTQQLAEPPNGHKDTLRCMKPPPTSILCPANRVVASHRALFYEE